jgi:hypothetical protein
MKSISQNQQTGIGRQGQQQQQEQVEANARFVSLALERIRILESMGFEWFRQQA